MIGMTVVMISLFTIESNTPVGNKLNAKTYASLFSKQNKFTLGNIPIATNPDFLAKISDVTSSFLKQVLKNKGKYVKPTVGVLQRYNVTMSDVIETLDFIAQIAAHSPEKLYDCTFIDKYFTLYRWYAPDDKYETCFPQGHCTFPHCLRITHYNVAKLHASTHKKGEYVIPLYEKPSDEHNKCPEEIRQNKSKHIRFSYGRKKIMRGILDNKKEMKKPFAWVMVSEYKNLVRQGSGMLAFSDGTHAMVEVAAHNGMKGDDSYWYCALIPEVPQGKKYHHKIRPLPGVSFAGDIENVGLGKLLCTIGINQETGKREAHLGVLMDTGTAFKNNPYHLDLYMGYFDNPLHFVAHSKKFPASGQVYILIKKEL